MFIDDIERGIPETNVKAGILKCVTEKYGVTEDVNRVLRAVAQAHRATGVPISTHSNAVFRTGLEQQRVFREEGVDLSRVVIGHSGDTDDIEYLEELIGAGSYVGMDRFGTPIPPDVDGRVETIATLCRHGHADRIVLSHDTNCFIDFVPEEFRSLPHNSYLYLFDVVLAKLLDAGVPQEHVDQMLIRNPRDIFAVPRGSY
jgi:phosphotriesterase-related protein